MAWYYPAIISALCWGLYYPVAEYLLDRYSGSSILVATHLTSALVFSGIFPAALKKDFNTLLKVPNNDIGILLGLAVLCILANYVSFLAISYKNAILVSLVEISYPLFAVCFAIVLYQRNHVNLWTLCGGAFILLGVVIVSAKA